MKLVTQIIFGMSILVMTACGVAPEAETIEKEKSINEKLCGCFEMTQAMSKAFEEANGDADKMNEIEEKHKSELDACRVLGNKMEKSMDELSADEKDEKMKEFENDCPAYKKLMDEY